MPPGLPYIVVNEAAERYSFYGMRSILTVFMTAHLLDRSGALDPMTEQQARVWYHGFVAAVYFMPLLGGLLADLFWGKYRTIIALSLVYCVGHLVLALDATRWGLSVGLALIAVGAGGIKPTVSAHLGDQFRPGQAHLVDRAFARFYLAINVGAVLSMLSGEWLLVRFGPHVAFGIPGALMLLATVVFWTGRERYRTIPAEGARAWWRGLSAEGGLPAVARLVPLFAVVAVFWSLYDQTGSSWVQQARNGLMDRSFQILGREFILLPSQIQAVNPLLILGFVPLIAGRLVPWAERRGWRPTPLRLIGLGLVLAAASFAVITAVEARLYAGRPAHVSGQLGAYVLLSAGEVLLSMTCLAFAYTQAPNRAKSLVMGLYFLSFAAGNYLAVEVNRFLERPVAVVFDADGRGGHFTAPRPIADEQRVAFEGLEELSAVTAEGDTLPLQGTFLLRGTDPSAMAFGLRRPDTRQELRVLDPPAVPVPASVNRLRGPAYFGFFTVLMLLAAAVFVPLARRYRYRQALQPDP